MNNDQFSQKEVLIGGAGKTKGFKVSDDPMLMSMLSTGFYANPHRAMIQEIMFNAWDAHRMGKCQDKPIDIFVDEHSGFTVRDYGPGIADHMMEDVYCTYAASTKRDDADMTGGFGLGSKAPWSYTESFTVTSHHDGVKTMYLMSRVSDEADGKPGMTPLMSFQTDESGLSVSVPLEEGSLHNTKNIIYDVLYLSGIKAQLHFKDREPTLVESMDVKPKQYVMDTREGNFTKELYAVYGGVRYLIPQKDEYKEEFQFMNMISEISSLFIGFAPHTLSPLPNREGLNMSTNTKENIRVGLELCMERFQTVFEPVLHAYFRDRMDNYKAGNVEPHFALFHAVAHYEMKSSFMVEFQEKMLPLCPPNTDKTVWEIAIKILVRSPKSIVNVVSKRRWMAILLKHFVRVYPDSRDLAYKMMKEDPESMIGGSYRHTDFIEQIISSWTQPAQLTRLFEFESAMVQDFPEDGGFARPKLRLRYENDWLPMERHRNAPKGIAQRYMSWPTRKVGTKAVSPEVKYLDPTQIWFSKDGEPVQQFFMSNVVILAKTVNALRETDPRVQGQFSLDNRYISDYTGNSKFGLLPAYVVHSRKGQYDRALEVLTNLGYIVIQANEPEVKVYGKGAVKKAIVSQFRRINTSTNNWQMNEIDPDDKDYDVLYQGTPLTNPKYFLYVKQYDLGDNYYRRYSSSRPSKTLVALMLAIEPDIAMVNNVTQAEKLQKDGVKPFSDLVIKWSNDMGKKVYRLRNIVRVIKVLNESNISNLLIGNAQIQSAMGIARIKEDDATFWNEMDIINVIKSEYYSPLLDTTKQMTKLIDQVWVDDPQKEKVKKAIKATNLLSETKLDHHWRALDPSKRDEFASKIARFIRTM
jgi:hypothetical protein